MAKLVIGANKTNGVPAIVKEVIVPPSLGTKTVTTNGTYNASSDNYDGYSSVTVSVQASLGTKTISTNGTYNASSDNYDGYSSVTVSVPSVSEPYLELEVMPNGNLRHSTTTSRLLPLSGFSGINEYVLAYAYRGNANISGDVNFTSLTSIAGTCACYGAFRETHVSSFSAPMLTTISGAQACQTMFQSSWITTASMPELKTISGNSACQSMFSMSRVSSVNLSKLETVSTNGLWSAFYDCDYLSSITFDSLKNIDAGYVFYKAFENSGIQSISFPALTSTSFGVYNNQFVSMLSGVTGCTIHFPTNLNPANGSTVISSLNGYPDFGGTNTIILYDLPQTEN